MARQWQWTGDNGQRRQRRLGWSDVGSDLGLGRGACVAGAKKGCAGGGVRSQAGQSERTRLSYGGSRGSEVHVGALAAAEAVKCRAPAGMAQEETGEGRRWCK